mgnify:CR=1 FL=1
MSEVRAALLDLAHMVASLASRLTHVNELVPRDDHFIGYCNACVARAGGVHCTMKPGPGGPGVRTHVRKMPTHLQ